MTQTAAITPFSAAHRFREAINPVAVELGEIIRHLAAATAHQTEEKKPSYRAAHLFLVAAHRDMHTMTDLRQLDGRLNTSLHEIRKVEPDIQTTYAPSLLIVVARNTLKAAMG